MWRLVTAWFSRQAEALLMAAIVLLASYCALLAVQRHVADGRLAKARSELATLQATTEQQARIESERRRTLETTAEASNVHINLQLAAASAADHSQRAGVVARLRERAAASTGAGAAASAPACTCGGLDVPPAAQLSDVGRERVVEIAAAANATGRALAACQQYIADVVLPACAPGTLMQGGQ